MAKTGFIYHLTALILSPFIRRVRLTEPNLKSLKKTMAKGQVLFVSQTASIIDFLVVSETLKRHKLDGISFTHGIPSIFTTPLRYSLSTCLKRMFRSIELRAEWEKTDIVNAVRKGGNGLVFLKNRWRLFSSKTFYYQGFFQEMIEKDRQAEGIYLVPTSIFLTRKRKSLTRSGWEILFGTYDIPSRPRKLYQLITHVNRGLTVFSKPIHIHDKLEGFEEMEPSKLDKRLRWTLLFHLNNEEHAYRGPTKRHLRQKVRLILKDKILRKELEQIAERQNRSIESVMKEAEKNLSNMTSDTNDRVLFILKTIFDFVWYRTLDGVDYDSNELAMIRELSKKGPLILLPSHRSHVDYLVLAHLFEKQGLNPPRFAAGDNLSRWPLGPVLRRAGAFFIRRSFRGEAIFPVVFEAYIRQALRDRQPITFFMEGGRSRTGKLLNPKVGMLGMILNSWNSGLVEHIPLIPITIDYGKVFEGQSYLDEKSGAEKKKEGLKSLLSTPKFLKRKHGVVRIRISDPLYFETELEKAGLAKDQLTFRNKIPFLNSLSDKIMSQINSRVSLTAGNIVAGILLANPKRGMTYEDLKTIFTLCVRYLRNKGVELAFHDKKFEGALDHALHTFESWDTVFQAQMGKNRIITIPVDKRNEMEFYKNNGLHFLLELALFSSSIAILPQNKRTLEEIKALSKEIFEIFSSEFILPEHFFENIEFEDVAKIYEKNGGLKCVDGLYQKGESDIGFKTLRVTSHLILNFIESYFCVTDAILQEDFEDELPIKDVQKIIMTRSKLLYTVGTILIPESRNHVNFNNALNMLRSQRYLQFRNLSNQKGKHVTVNPSKLEKLKDLHQTLYEWMDALQ